MDVLLVNPNSRIAGQVGNVPILTPPLNLMYVAQCLLDAGYRTRILDAYALNLGQSEILDRIKGTGAELVGFPLYSTDLTMMHRLTHSVKETSPETRIFLAGPHASALPHEVMQQFPNADFVIRGEGERVTPAMVDALERHRPLLGVRGLTYRDGTAIKHNRDMPAISNLDSIPIPSRDLIESSSYYSRLTRERRIGIIITSRGCPYHCTFCPKLHKTSHGYRKRSVKNVIEEMRVLHERGVRALDIYDGTFTLDRRRSLTLLEAIKQEGFDFELWIRTRVTHIDNELLGKLKGTGCSLILYGIESGNQSIIDAAQRETSLPEAMDAFRKTEKHGINIIASFIIGLRGETPETIRETVAFAKKLNPLFASFNVLHPFPGSKIYEQAKLDGSLIGDYGPYLPRPWIKLPWTRDVGEMYAYSEQAYKSFYWRPAHMKKYLTSVLRDHNWNLLKYSLETFTRGLSRRDPLNNYRK